MSTIKINVRRNGAEEGCLGRLNPVLGMVTIDGLTLQVLNTDGTVVVSKNTSIGGSGLAVRPDELFVDDTMAASGTLPGGLGAGSWPSGVDVQTFNWRAKTSVTTSH